MPSPRHSGQHAAATPRVHVLFTISPAAMPIVIFATPPCHHDISLMMMPMLARYLLFLLFAYAIYA